MEYFCEDCKVCICHKCGMTVHNNHKKKDMQHAAEDMKSEMEKMILKIQFFSLERKFVNSVTREILKPESVAVAKNGDLLLCLR